jgi:RsiW-degrading membrane proteinase PrsW (M82 family)
MLNQPPFATPPPTVMAVPPANNRRVLKWIALTAFLLFALLVGLLVFALIGADIFSQGGEGGPVALLIGLLFATLPVPLYILLVLWIDRYESEPTWMLGMAFIWGATIAAFLAFLINSIGGAVVTAVADERTGQAFGAVISAPLVEETAKAIVLFVLFFWKKDEFDGVIDGVVYASMVALGFAMTENIKYYGEAALGGGGVFTVTFILRGAMSPFAHPLFTSMTGIGLGWARQSDNRVVKYLMPPLGLLAAILLHGTWNFSAMLARQSGALFLLIYFVLMVPAFVAALVVVFFALRGEGRILQEYLQCDIQTGMLSPEEYSRLCSVRGRFSSSISALTRGGFSQWRARKQLNQIASELAFHRRRVARGFYSNNEAAIQREIAYVNQLLDLRRTIEQGGK